jgi:putative SOS response-associated peptidase YedK
MQSLKPNGASEVSRCAEAASLKLMCGRFGASYRDIKIVWNLYGDFSFQTRYNVAPSQEVPVIIRQESRNEAKIMKWGLVPSWAPDPSTGNRMINARSETLLEKPSFKESVSKRRCLIPANGFYEWRREGKCKVPMWIQLTSREPFAFPGLWDRWIDRDTGTPLYTFTIITTRANALVEPIHDRMPVIYNRDMGRQWLEQSFGNWDLGLSLVLQPLPSERFEAYEVSTLVNSSDNDSSECVRRVSSTERVKSQLSHSNSRDIPSR